MMVKQTYPSYIRASEISELVQNKSPSMDPTREFITKADYDELHAAKEALFRMHQDVCDRAIKLAEDRDFWKQQAGMVTNKLAAEVIENDKLRKIIAEPGEGNRYRLLMNENQRLQAELRLSRTITEQLQRAHKAMEELMAVPAGEYETKLILKINDLEKALEANELHNLDLLQTAYAKAQALQSQVTELKERLSDLVIEVDKAHWHDREVCEGSLKLARQALENIRGQK